MLLDEIGTRLDDQGIASSSGDDGWVLVKSMLPDSSALQNKIVALIDTPGGSPSAYTELDEPHFQVLVRGDPITTVSSAYQEARSKIDEVKRDLHAITPRLLSDTHFAGIWALQDPFLLEYDKSDRPVLAINFRALRERTSVLFSYSAGDSLAASSSFGRITSSSAPATFADIAIVGASSELGTVSTAANNEARIQWMSTASSAGPRTFKTLLLEDSRKNLIDESDDFGEWTLNNNLSRSSEQTSPSGSTDAWLLTSSSAAARGFISRDSTFESSIRRVLSVFAKPNDSTQSLVELRSSDGTIKIDMQIDWSGGIPSMSIASAGSSVAVEEQWRDGFWRMQAVSTADLSTGIYTTRLYPAASGTTDSAFFYGAQLE